MKNRIIRTVVGDIDPKLLGYCQCHEHLFIAKGKAGDLVPSLIMEDLDKTTRELLLYYDKGGRAVVDAQPVGCGRMAMELLQASKQSGVHIVASTGFHKLDFYEDNHFVFKMDQEELTQLFIKELTVGMETDGGKNGFPSVEGGLAKAGMIKTASDGRDIRSPDPTLAIYKKLFLAAGKAAKVTGAPVMTHLEMGKGAFSQLDVLTSQGIAPDRVMMSHLDRVTGSNVWDYQLQVAKSGVYLQLDTIGRFKYHSDQEEVEFIAMLCEKGYEDKIVIGLDTTKERMINYGGSIGLNYIIDTFRGKLKEYGIGDDLFHRFTVLNPMRAICMEV
jgi:phosphotriesterase-related protein